MPSRGPLKILQFRVISCPMSAADLARFCKKTLAALASYGTAAGTLHARYRRIHRPVGTEVHSALSKWGWHSTCYGIFTTGAMLASMHDFSLRLALVGFDFRLENGRLKCSVGQFYS